MGAPAACPAFGLTCGLLRNGYRRRCTAAVERRRVYCASTRKAPRSKDVLPDNGSFISFQSVGAEQKIGRVEKSDGKTKCTVTTTNGLTFEVNIKQILYRFEPQSSDSQSLAQFEAVVTELTALAVDKLRSAWEKLVVTVGEADEEQIANAIFESLDPVKVFAVCRALSKDKVYFKRKISGLYSPRPSEQVAELELLREKASLKVAESRGKLQRIKQAIQTQDLTKLNTKEAEHVRAVEKLALTLGVRLPPNRKRTRDEQVEHEMAEAVLSELNLPVSPQGAYDAMVMSGLFAKHENVPLRRSFLYPPAFDENLCSEVKSVLDRVSFAEEQKKRTDFRAHRAYGVDMPETTDVDDAISLERMAGKIKYWVHVSDPTAWLEVDDRLTQEAFRRSLSLYLPCGPISMFPHELVEKAFSLCSQESTVSLSVGFTFDESGSLRDDFELKLGVISAEKISYDDVNQLLTGDTDQATDQGMVDDFQELEKAAVLRRRHRSKEGAMLINLPDPVVRVTDSESDEPKISITVPDTETSGWLIVQEMMIAAGEAVGRYCAREGVLVPFRTQSAVSLTDEDKAHLKSIPDLCAQAMALFKYIKSTETSLRPGPHSGVGVGTYVQITSPIRRAMDLVAHFQIKAHLEGRAQVFDEDELVPLMCEIGSTSKQAKGIENRSVRYWMFEQLRRNEVSGRRFMQGVVVNFRSEDQRIVSVMLDEYRTQILARSKIAVPLGQRVVVEISNVDPKLASLRAFIRKQLQPSDANEQLPPSLLI